MINLEPELLEILACPQCKSPLQADQTTDELVCTNAECGLAYPVRDDIPVLLVDEARRPNAAAEAEDTAEDSTDTQDATGSENPGGGTGTIGNTVNTGDAEDTATKASGTEQPEQKSEQPDHRPEQKDESGA